MKQVHPPSEIVNQFVDTVLTDTIKSIAQETEASVVCSIDMCTNEAIEFYRTLTLGRSKKQLKLRVRIRFKEGYGNRYIMFAESLFDEEEALYGCSGFSLKAECKGGVVMRKSQTVRYNVWNWTGWI